MKKILFVAAGLGAGGAERQITTVACLMKQAGYDVAVYCWNNEDFFDKVLKDNNIKIHRIIAGGVKRLLNVRKFIRNGNFDAVISFLPTPNFCNEFAAIGGKHWKVVTGERSSKVHKPSSVKEYIYHFAEFFADIKVCNSWNSCAKWKEIVPGVKSKITTIYNAVIIGDTLSTYIPRVDNKLHVVVTASIYKIKNPLGLLDAIVMMNEEERNCLVIDWYGNSYAATGDDVEFQEFRKGIEYYNLKKIIRIHPATSHVVDVIKKADAVALFSMIEGLPNAICEGMMVGKPVIMTRVSDYSVLIDESNGFLCEWDKPETIKDALLNAARLTSPQLAMMGESSKEKALKLFSPSVISKKWIDVIEG